MPSSQGAAAKPNPTEGACCCHRATTEAVAEVRSRRRSNPMPATAAAGGFVMEACA